MAHKASRKSNNDEDSNSLPLRQKLPRTCKSIPPCYVIDLDLDEEDINDHYPRTKKEKGSRSLNIKKTTAAQDIVLSNTTSTVKLSDNLSKSLKDTQEINIYSTSSILSWLIEMKLVKRYSMVTCFDNGKMISVGLIDKTDMIVCCECENWDSKKCHGKWHSVYNFFIHSGYYHSVDKCYENMFNDSDVSLLTCQIEAWKKNLVPAQSGYLHVERRPRIQGDENDSCVICADGGKLICCRSCFSTYHSKCVAIKNQLQDVLEDNWLCPYCCCKDCYQDSYDLLLTCVQCLKKYHWHCSKESNSLEHRLQPASNSFCSNKCWKVYQTLEENLGKRMPIISEEYSWTIVRRTDLGAAGQSTKRMSLIAYCNSMVVLAAKLMEESCKPKVERQTRTNVIQSVVYNCGSNLTPTNFSRFYTAVLEHCGRVISAASLRILSPQIAEIPFIATSKKWRRQGICKHLMTVIETILSEMEVKRIIIPSSDEMIINWQEKFGFIQVDEETQEELKSLNTLIFPGTTRLMKIIPETKKVLLDINYPPAEEAEA